jgi:hypothetical protein
MDTIPDMLENLKHGTWNEFFFVNKAFSALYVITI